MDYLLPGASEIRRSRSSISSIPPRNPLGIKGVGEGGAIAPRQRSPMPWRTLSPV